MDELLALMEESPPEEESPPPQSDEQAGMDELAYLMDESPPPLEEQTTTPRPPPYSGRSTPLVTPTNYNSAKRQPSSSKQPAPPAARPADVSVDDRLGIRMLNRNLSSIDLLDLISVNPYHSPASLSAMSLSALTRLLVDPPRLVDKATVFGKTNVVTVGVVFSNTGTRISAKGGAFCVLTIGSFVSGPCVTVLLFGEVYSKCCRSCVPGKVVALAMPRLLPPKNGEDTSISVSVSDRSQLLMVATARDYGVCKATVRAKQPDGQWTQNGKCKNYVDKRKCEFCDVHRKQKFQTSSNMRAGQTTGVPQSQQKGGMTWMQKARSEMEPLQNNRSGNTVVQNNNNGQTSNRLLNPPSAKATAATAAKSGNGRNIPMHMKKEQPLAGRASSIKQRKAATDPSNSNRLLNGSMKPAPQKKKLGIVGSADWMKVGTAKRQPSTSLAQQYTKKKQKHISTLGAGGFDGSVAVPKPNRLFQSRAPTVMAKASTTVIPNEPPREKILQKQIEVAQRLKEQQAAVAPPNNASNCKSSSKGNSQHAKKRAGNGGSLSFLDSLNVDVEKVLKAKSRFANEASAEHYARQRRIVTELEKQEASKEKSDKRKAGTEKQGLTKEWICTTCGGTKFSKRPSSCIASNHTVKFSRELTKTLSRTEQRTKLHDKTVDEGGLRLGAGLDWSRTWSRFS